MPRNGDVMDQAPAAPSPAVLGRPPLRPGRKTILLSACDGEGPDLVLAFARTRGGLEVWRSLGARVHPLTCIGVFPRPFGPRAVAGLLVSGAVGPHLDPSTPRLYDLLSRTGEADLPSHVAMARWCAVTGDLARAGKLADALVTLFPGDPQAWRCKGEVARAAGDAATADECNAEAAMRGSAPAPFAVPGVARG
jgi:hypothetical protein